MHHLYLLTVLLLFTPPHFKALPVAVVHTSFILQPTYQAWYQCYVGCRHPCQTKIKPYKPFNISLMKSIFLSYILTSGLRQNRFYLDRIDFTSDTTLTCDQYVLYLYSAVVACTRMLPRTMKQSYSTSVLLLYHTKVVFLPHISLNSTLQNCQ